MGEMTQLPHLYSTTAQEYLKALCELSRTFRHSCEGRNPEGRGRGVSLPPRGEG